MRMPHKGRPSGASGGLSRGETLRLIIMAVVAVIVVAFIAQWIMGESRGFFSGENRVDWGRALLLGLAGSFIGGLLVSLLNGDGLALRPSGLIGSVIGAIVFVLAERLIRRRN